MKPEIGKAAVNWICGNQFALEGTMNSQPCFYLADASGAGGEFGAAFVWLVKLNFSSAFVSPRSVSTAFSVAVD